MSALRFLLEKEFKQFFRNSFLPRVLIGLPVMVMLLLPQVTQMDCQNITVSLVDKDHSSLSERLIRKIASSTYFIYKGNEATFEDAMDKVESENLDVILEIPQDFEKEWLAGKAPLLNISANSVNSMKGSLGSSYLNHTIQDFNKEEADALGIESVAMDKLITVRNTYNPYLDYKYFMIPALMVMLVIVLCGFLPALNIIGEKEKGTIEQMNVTPVGRFEFILGKLIPYWCFGLLVLTISIFIGWLVYGLYPAGNIGLIYLVATLFILTMSGFGLLVSNFSSTMQQAIFVMFFFIMICMLMSGLFTPVVSMPEWAQKITILVPPKYFINIMRDVYLKGCTFADEWVNYLALLLFSVVMGLAATLSYKKQNS